MTEIINALNNLKNTTDVQTDIKNLVRMFSNKCNTLGMKPVNICAELSKSTNIDEFITICETWIIYLTWCYKKHFYDGRNEIACERASEILKILGINDYYINTCYEEFEKQRPTNADIIFAINMGREHRTIIQTFSQIPFYMMYQYSSKSIALHEAVLNKTLSEWFYEMPLI